MKNNLNTLLFSVLFFASFLQINAQNTPSGGLEVSPYIDLTNTKIPESARGLIIDKLGNLLTAKGITNAYDSAIIITPNINEISKDILGSSSPVLYAVTLDVNLYIGNKIDGRLFANKNITTKGSGTSMDKAYINAFQQIKFNDPAFVSLIENAKLKIIDYYNQRCTQIINAATALGSRNQYDQAIYNLLQYQKFAPIATQKVSIWQLLFSIKKSILIVKLSLTKPQIFGMLINTMKELYWLEMF